jgi:acyl-CoA synthetase (AMP-forming)/AMP-acid ligase II
MKRTGVLNHLLEPHRRCAIHFLEEKRPTNVRQTVSLKDLGVQVHQTAAMLVQAGLKPGDRVVMCVPTGVNFVAWFLGALWTGVIPVPVPGPARLQRKPMVYERLAGVLKDCAPNALIVDPSMRPYLGAYEGKIRILPAEKRGDAAVGRNARGPDADDDIAFLQYTAGSTGDPKGVVVLRRNLRANLQAIGEAVNVSEKDRVLSWLPLYHDMGLVGTFLFSLFWKLPLFLYSPTGFVQKPSGWLQAISEHRITLAPGPHFAYALCARKLPERELKDLNLKTWRLALDGSEPVRPSTMRLFLERFAKYGFSASAYHPVYGMSEATLAIAMPRPSEGPRVDRVDREALTRHGVALPVGGEVGAAEYVSVGRALPGHKVEIRDLETGELCADRRMGQVCFQGPSVTPHYFNLRNPYLPERPYLETGDLGYLADGRLYIVDRAKDVIIHAGANLYPSDLERTVETVIGIRRGQVVVFGAPSLDSGTEGVVVAAEITSRSQAATIEAQVRSRVASAFGLSLERVVLLPPKRLPTTLNGKLMRAQARKDYLAGRLGKL